MAGRTAAAGTVSAVSGQYQMIIGLGKWDFSVGREQFDEKRRSRSALFMMENLLLILTA